MSHVAHPISSRFERRAGLLMGSSLSAGAIGAAFLSLGFFVAAPGAAFAAAECGIGAMVTCAPAGNPYAGGISYAPLGDLSLTLQPGVVVNTSANANPAAVSIVEAAPIGAVTVNADAMSSIVSAGDGIRVVNLGSGPSSISSGAIVAGATGVNLVNGAGGFSIIASGPITAVTHAISVNSASGGSITVGSGMIVRGGGDAGGAVVDIITPAGQLTTVTNIGQLLSTNPSVTASDGDLALRATGGSLVFNNRSRVDGWLDLSAHAAPDQAIVNNISYFQTAANSLFAPGINGGVGKDVFNNSGSLYIRRGTAAVGNVTMVNLGTFNNTGLVSLANARAGDTLTLPGTFNGGTGSLLALDANLSGAPGQTSCASPAVADCLVLPGGKVTGVTAVQISNLSSAPAGLNSKGILIVDATGGSIAPGAFVLDPATRGYETRGGAGAIKAGFLFYRLAPIGTTQEILVAVPDNTAYEFAQFGAAATDLWYAASGTWLDRESDVRLAGNDLTAGGGQGAVWLKATGDIGHRNSTSSANSLGTTFTYDTTYSQSSGLFVGGADLLRHSSNGGGWALGLDGGYVESNLYFRASGTSVRLTGPTVGGYASVFRGPIYVDASVTANFLDLDDRVPQVIDASNGYPVETRGKVRSVGGQMESGFKIPLGSVLSVEPMGTIAYVNTHFDDLPIPGGRVAFKDVESLRTSSGLRLAAALPTDRYVIKASVFGRAWDEFRGRDSATLYNPGSPLLTADRFRGVFGDVGGQMAIFGKGGVSGFINADYKFKKNYADTTISGGVRYQF